MAGLERCLLHVSVQAPAGMASPGSFVKMQILDPVVGVGPETDSNVLWVDILLVQGLRSKGRVALTLKLMVVTANAYSLSAFQMPITVPGNRIP